MNGGDIRAWRFGVRDFYGTGDQFEVDSSKRVTITTPFATDAGTDDDTIVDKQQPGQRGVSPP